MEKGRKKLLILLCCLFPGMMGIQGQGVLTEFPINGRDNLVRYYYGSNHHIACSRHGNGNNVHFDMTDMNTMIDVSVATDLRVTDFEIIDRLVFFCGNTAGGSGFLGWFDIDSLFYLGGSAHIDGTLSSYGLKSLDNIELYHNQAGDICIAGYGNANGTTTVYRAFEAVGSLSTGMQYRVLELPLMDSQSRIVDMAVTDNYVVYMEHFKSNECNIPFGIGINLHSFPKYNMLASWPNPYYYFETSDHTTTSFYGLGHDGLYHLFTYEYPISEDPHYNAPPQMTHYGNDRIAVCSHRRDISFSFNPLYTHPHPCGGDLLYTNTYVALRTYDLSPMLTGNPILMTSAAIAQLYSGSCPSIDGLEYDALSHFFVALHRHESSAGILEHAFTTFDYTLGVPPAVAHSFYQTSYDTRTYWMPSDMCQTPGSRYTVSGYKQSNKDYVFWNDLIFHESINCETLIPYAMNNIPTMICKEEQNYNHVTDWIPLQFVWREHGEQIDKESVILCK